MKNKEFIILVAVALSIIGIVILWFRYSTDVSDSLSFFIAIVISILVGFLASVVSFFLARHKKKKIYVSFPIEKKGMLVPLVFGDHGAFSSEDIYAPGVSISETIRKHLKHIERSYFIIIGDLSNTQKLELKELKRNKTEIIPVLYDEGTKLPIQLEDISPMSFSEFINIFAM